jgi:hypothetical protein
MDIILHIENDNSVAAPDHVGLEVERGVETGMS